MKEAYFYACQSLDVGHNSRDVDLTYEQYCNNSTFWAWTLSPDMDGNSGVCMIQKPGNFELDIYVAPGTANPALTALVVGKFGSTVRIAEDNITTLV